MTNIEIAQHRLFNQHIARQAFNTPADVVKYMGAMQAQDYAGAKWAVGLRLQNGNDAAVDEAMANGSIIRTHVLRPTWHFVSPTDLHWMLDLSAHRIIAMSASRDRQLKLDSAIFKSSNDALGKALVGEKELNRQQMMEVLQQAGVDTNEERFVHLLMRAELDRVICSGARQGKQFSYRLFDERVPMGNDVLHEEALAQLVRGYFISRGPATVADFAWWSGLTLAETKVGLEIAKPELTDMEIEERVYWMAKDAPDLNTKASAAFFLPAFDEFAVAYSDRTAAVNSKYALQARHVIFDPAIILKGQVVGTWKRTVKKNGIEIELNPFGKLNKIQEKAIGSAAKSYKKFMGV